MTAHRRNCLRLRSSSVLRWRRCTATKKPRSLDSGANDPHSSIATIILIWPRNNTTYYYIGAGPGQADRKRARRDALELIVKPHQPSLLSSTPRRCLTGSICRSNGRRS